MVKITHKKITNANLRQVIRSNIGKIANIRKNIQQPKQTNNTSKFLSYNIQDINTPNFLSHDIQNVIQYETRGTFSWRGASICLWLIFTMRIYHMTMA